MKNSALIGILIVIVVGLLGFMVFRSPASNTSNIQTVLPVENGIEVTLYKSPTCGCCGEYSEYLGKKGYDVDVKLTQDMDAIKKQFTVPYELESCHTMDIEGYVIEGHVPEEAIAKLLANRPDIKGIGMGGMPSGSPGMPGPKISDFVVYEITNDGNKGGVFMTI